MEKHNSILTKKVRKKFFALVVLFSTSLGVIYGQNRVYLDPSSSSPIEDGTITNPYKSFDNASLVFTSGYTYSVKRGTTMNVTRKIFVRPSYVTINAYGTGARPIISSSVGETEKILDVSLSPNFTIRDIELKAVNRALTVINIQGAPNTKVINCKLHEAHYGLRNIASDNTIYIDSVEIYNIQQDGIYFNGADSVIIKNSHIHHVNQAYFIDQTEQGSYGDAIQLDAPVYFYVGNNILDRSDTGNKFCFITGSTPCPGSVFEYNKCYGSPNLGAHMYIINTEGLLIRHNLFEGGPRSICGNGRKTRVLFNIFNNLTDGLFRQTTTSSQEYHNNVFANCNIVFSSWNDTMYVRNNIFYNVTQPYETYNLIESNNCYYLIGSALPQLDPTSITTNPQFVNYANKNFKLTTTSPCLKKGVNLGCYCDYEGTLLPVTGNYDMGAYYQSTGGDTQAPTVPTGLVSSNINQTSFTLTWMASTDNVGVTSYDVYRNGSFATNVTTTSANISDLTANTTYSMTVRARDAAGNVSSASSALNVTTLQAADTQAPSIPTGLASSNIGQTNFTLTWNASTDNVGVTSYDVYRNGSFATNVTTTSANISGLTAGTTYSMTVRARDAAGNVSNASSALNVTTLGTSGLPSPWSSQNIGNVGLQGGASYNNGVFTVTGSGADIWGTADGFRYVYQPLHGDGEIKAYVSSLTNPDGWSKVGLMIRGALTAGSAHAMVSITPSRGVCFQRRISTGGTSTTTTTGAIVAPIWLRIVRAGNVITGYRSTNNINWTQVGTETIPMATDVYIGLNVCAHNNATTCTATFEQVSLILPDVDTQAPTTPTGLTANNVTQSGFTLSWNASTDNVGVTGYNVFQNSTFLTSVTSTSANISSLSAGTSYGYTIVARDEAGNLSSASSSLNVTTLSTCTGGPIPWTNNSFTNQTGTFTAEFDVIPGANMMSGILGLSNGSTTSFSNLACIVRFNDIGGVVDVRNGGTYTATNSFPYTANTAYHVRMEVNISTHRYDVYIKQIGGSEVLIASQYAFRSEQASVTQLNNRCLQTDKNCLAISNFAINGLKSARIELAEAQNTEIKPVKIYPNPASTLINVEVPDKSIIQILSINGRTVLQQIVEPGNSTIPLKLSAGIYVLQVIGVNNKKYTQKLLVK